MFEKKLFFILDVKKFSTILFGQKKIPSQYKFIIYFRSFLKEKEIQDLLNSNAKNNEVGNLISYSHDPLYIFRILVSKFNNTNSTEMSLI